MAFNTLAAAPRKPVFLLMLAILIFGMLAVRQHRLVDRYAVNVMYWDQWDLYGPMFRGQGWWASFDLQHGPHRQGLGGVLTRILADASRWNTRGDAFAVSFILIVATVVAGALVWQCGGHWALPLVPLIVLTPRQFDSLAVIPNPSHGALPVLLLLLVAWTWFIRRNGLRLTLLSLLTVTMIFTGFGFFAALIVPLVLAVEALYAFDGRDRRHTAQVIGALLAIAAGWGLFAYGYVFDPALEGFKFPWDRPVEYVWFVGVMYANAFGISGTGPASIAFGLAIAAGLAGLVGRSGRQMVRVGPLQKPRDTIIFLLASFCLLYAIDTAIGRVMLGIGGGAAPRYVTLLIPAGLALLLEFSDPATPRKNGVLIPLAALLIVRTTTLRLDELNYLQTQHDQRLAWRLAYLQTHSVAAANRQSGITLYQQDRLAERLRILEQRHLNLFDAAAFP